MSEVQAALDEAWNNPNKAMAEIKTGHKTHQIVQWLARQKFCIDLGISFLVFWNYILLAITASAYTAPLLGIRARWVAIGTIITTMFGMWFIGYILDKTGFPKAYQAEINERNEMLKEIKNG